MEGPDSSNPPGRKSQPAAAFDDSAWEAIALPHTWNAKDGNAPGFYQEDGWYRRCFQVPAAWAGKRIYVQFDGANRSAEVFLNGHRLGQHRGGFARFRLDATSAADGNGSNVLAVRVNNDPHDNLAPVSADFTFFGGLYRAVSLVATDPVHIDMLDHAAPGVYVRQKQVTADAAELDLQVKLANAAATTADVTVRTTITEADGTPVQTVETQASLAALARGETRSRLLLAHPHLWNGQADPYLYRVQTEVVVAGGVRDAVTLPLGLRFFSVDPARGCSLNGRHLDLHGVNRHQDRPGKGWAISEADEREDFAMIEEIGATAARQSHYQQSQLWNNLGDECGMVMWAELAYVNDARDNREFSENAKEQLRERRPQRRRHAGPQRQRTRDRRPDNEEGRVLLVPGELERPAGAAHHVGAVRRPDATGDHRQDLLQRRGRRVARQRGFPRIEDKRQPCFPVARGDAADGPQRHCGGRHPRWTRAHGRL